MHKEMVVTATSGATSAAGVVSSWWLWLTDQNTAIGFIAAQRTN